MTGMYLIIELFACDVLHLGLLGIVPLYSQKDFLPQIKSLTFGWITQIPLWYEAIVQIAIVLLMDVICE